MSYFSIDSQLAAVWTQNVVIFVALTVAYRQYSEWKKQEQLRRRADIAAAMIEQCRASLGILEYYTAMGEEGHDAMDARYMRDMFPGDESHAYKETIPEFLNDVYLACDALLSLKHQAKHGLRDTQLMELFQNALDTIRDHDEAIEILERESGTEPNETEGKLAALFLGHAAQSEVFEKIYERLYMFYNLEVDR